MNIYVVVVWVCLIISVECILVWVRRENAIVAAFVHRVVRGDGGENGEKGFAHRPHHSPRGGALINESHLLNPRPALSSVAPLPCHRALCQLSWLTGTCRRPVTCNEKWAQEKKKQISTRIWAETAWQNVMVPACGCGCSHKQPPAGCCWISLTYVVIMWSELSFLYLASLYNLSWKWISAHPCFFVLSHC